MFPMTFSGVPIMYQFVRDVFRILVTMVGACTYHAYFINVEKCVHVLLTNLRTYMIF